MSWGTLLGRTAANFTMVPSWFDVEVINGVYWTLSIEIMFYIIMFALLYYNRLDWTVPVLTSVVALALFDRLVALRWPNPVTFWLRGALGLDHLHVILLGVLVYKNAPDASNDLCIDRVVLPSAVFPFPGHGPGVAQAGSAHNRIRDYRLLGDDRPAPAPPMAAAGISGDDFVFSLS